MYSIMRYLGWNSLYKELNLVTITIRKELIDTNEIQIEFDYKLHLSTQELWRLDNSIVWTAAILLNSGVLLTSLMLFARNKQSWTTCFDNLVIIGMLYDMHHLLARKPLIWSNNGVITISRDIRLLNEEWKEKLFEVISSAWPEIRKVYLH